MPLVQCPECRTSYKVKLDIVGREIRCKRCSETFVAEVKRSGPRSTPKAAPVRPILYGAAALFLVAIIIIQVQPDDDPVPTDQEQAAAKDGDPSDESSEANPEQNPSESVASTSTAEGTVRMMLGAMTEEDHGAIASLMNFAAIWSDTKGPDDPTWSELDESAQLNKRREWVEAMITEASVSFLESSTVDAITASEGASENDAVVDVRLVDPVDLSTQEHKFQLTSSRGRWFITSHEAGEIVEKKDDAPLEVKEENLADLSDVKVVSGEAEIVVLEYPEDTTRDVISRIEGAIHSLKDLSNTTNTEEGRKLLHSQGKAAVIGLLNDLGSQDFESSEDRRKAFRVVRALRDITGEDFGYVPAAMDGSMTTTIAADNARAIRLWFGWWRDNNKAFESKPYPETKEDRRKKRRNRQRRDR